MATIRKRFLPSGKVRWQVDFVDQAGGRRVKLFARRKDADSFFVSARARARVQAGSYLHDAGSISRHGRRRMVGSLPRPPGCRAAYGAEDLPRLRG